MVVKGTNFTGRKARLSAAYCDAHRRLKVARRLGDFTTLHKMRARMRAVTLAWTRLDDRIYGANR